MTIPKPRRRAGEPPDSPGAEDLISTTFLTAWHKRDRIRLVNDKKPAKILSGTMRLP